MKKFFMPFLFVGSALVWGQQIEFEEYTLPNGLHVILHQDNSTPVVTTGVMYHVGSKDEQVGKTGFAHFFEHLLFEGTTNIKRGEWFKIVSANGGNNGADTSQDRTYYYENFPSNKLEMGLWMEADRMRQPIINQIGVDTQKEVVKEEKRYRLDNSPYGKFYYGGAIVPHIFKKSGYRWDIIGSFEDLNSAKLEDFKYFSQKYYVPNNAVLVVAGDFKKDEAKRLIDKYFGVIPRGKDVIKEVITEDPITKEIRVTEYDANIQIPLLVIGYRTPGFRSKDIYALNILSNYLKKGKSSVLYKKYIDDKKYALQILNRDFTLEDYTIFSLAILPKENVSFEKLENELQLDIEKIQKELISEEDYQKILNSIENDIISSKSRMEYLTEALAHAYILEGNTNNINEELKNYKSVTREDLRDFAKKYFNKNQRLILHYLPEAKK
ncbi:peptidase M16 [Elizabethkingia anophelis]|uniref:M16 family metallopeptidase n=1 Tax=Elizabethkingia anophelis TaxID=1117645 RepID=UPI002012E8A7|nr:pitrilysin family protein [Elizabethkingia anophelis]MCL1690174.1 insulinase family protein [Elizabethkingia anophelis]MDV3575750.1 peptidase M16 [Elizabethkingia anophelis]MDV3601513.1 peptidase M16 [Elizabethkingia anophelis]MDV3608572.1 peptidase M16 [Elizabethkingia anophelis]MDV3640618.1 peptidase M16 [Elizabethkingia anophelis]